MAEEMPLRLPDSPDRGYIPRRIAAAAHEAMVREVSAAPKPGLVCPGHTGSHRDMDHSTFMASAAALHPYLQEAAALGYARCQERHHQVMPHLRAAGITGEQAMFAATGGVNTHKGLVFSLGLLAAACGRLAARNCALLPEDITREAALFIPDLVEQQLAPLKTTLPQRPLSAGEQLYLKYDVSGIRGEAQAGFPSALDALTVLTRTAALHPMNLALPHTLLHLMTHTPDTNVLWRSGMDGLRYVRRAARQALELGGMLTAEGTAKVMAMHDEFPRRNISPGGSADLLAIVIFLHTLQQTPHMCRMPPRAGE